MESEQKVHLATSIGGLVRHRDAVRQSVNVRRLGGVLTFALLPSLIWLLAEKLPLMDGEAATLSEALRSIALVPTHSSWNFVALYKGNITDPQLSASWTSQVGKDQTIVDVFDGNGEGYFVDLASNDAVSLSNTLTLERQFGWRGLCIEANPHYMRGYLHRTCQLVQAVAGPREDEAVSFKFSNGAYGGVVGDGFDNRGGTEKDSTSLQTVSVAKILRDFNAPHIIDYLSLDIEGAEAWAFQTFPWDTYTFLTLTVERAKPELIDMLRRNGYVYLCDHGGFGDQFWVHPELPSFEQVVAKYGAKQECRASS